MWNITNYVFTYKLNFFLIFFSFSNGNGWFCFTNWNYSRIHASLLEGFEPLNGLEASKFESIAL